MAGIKGRSGGHNRLSTQAHILRGTFRKDRHATGRTPAFADNGLPANDPAAVPPDELLAGLGEAGRALVLKLYPTGFWTVQAQIFLRIAASRLDMAAAARAILAKDGLLLDGKRHPMVLVERQAMRDFRDALRELELTPPTEIEQPADDPFAAFDVVR